MGCKVHNFVEKKVLSYLEAKYPENHYYSNPNNDSYRRSKMVQHISRRNNVNISINHNDFVDDTLITNEGGGISYLATSIIVTELHVESKQKESTIEEKHSLK